MSTRTYQNKIVIVAGGASGIGEQLARLLVSFSAKVIVLDRNGKAGAALQKSLPEIQFNVLDLSSADKVRRSIRHIIRKNGPVDYFFNAAGVFMGGEIRDTPIEDWERVTHANLMPMWNATSVIYGVMQKQGFGHIVNIASSAGLFPVPAMSIYGATKAAVVSLSLGLRNEARSLGVRVSVVCPTIVKTPLYETALYSGVDRKKVLELLETRKGLQTPDVSARRILKQAARNKAVIHTALSTRATWFLFRIWPSLYLRLAERVLMTYRKSLRIHK